MKKKKNLINKNDLNEKKVKNKYLIINYLSKKLNSIKFTFVHDINLDLKWKKIVDNSV